MTLANPLRLSRIRFIYPVLLGGVEMTNFQETDTWYSDQDPPDTRLCAYVLTLQDQIIIVKNRNGQTCFAPITNLVSGNFYPSTIEEAPVKKNGKVILGKTDPSVQSAIDLAEAELNATNIEAGVQLLTPKLNGATAPNLEVKPVVNNVSVPSQEKKAITKSTKRSPVVVRG